MGQPCEESAQIAIRLDAVGLAGFDERVKVRAGVRTGDRIGEQPALATHHKFALILPISGRKLRFITVGIRCMAAASRFETSNSAAVAMWCMSRPPLG
jgi:hypothetical protein